MNAANVATHSAGRAGAHVNTTRRATVNPVRVRFDGFELDEENALLVRNGQPIPLAPRPFTLLCALVRRPGSLVTKDALLDEVWGHQFYSDSVLKTAVSEVRTVLDDDSSAPRFIETVSRRGYRFIAAMVETVPASGISAIQLSGRPWDDGSRAQAFPRAVHATSDEVRYAQELKLRLRATYLGARLGELS
jgi:DNA-binding winged helix-turn-helix (wHTH) protein